MAKKQRPFGTARGEIKIDESFTAPMELVNSKEPDVTDEIKGDANENN